MMLGNSMRCVGRALLMFVASLVLLAGVAGGAQGGGNANLVLTSVDASGFPEIYVRARVTDSDGNVIPNLTAAHFRLTEQCELETQPVDQTVNVSTVEVYEDRAVTLTIDRSGSMRGQPMIDAKAAAKVMVGLLAAEDRAAVISFATNVTVDQGFTGDKQALKGAIQRLPDYPSRYDLTAFYRAIEVSLDELDGETGVRAVLAFTDGRNNQTPNDPDGAIALAQTLGIPVYTIGLGNVDHNVLDQIATETGGTYHYTPDSSELAEIYERIAGEMGAQYLLAYRTHNEAEDGTTRTVRVEVTVGGHTVSDTISYIAATPPAISLTQETRDLMDAQQPAEGALTITAEIISPVGVAGARLFYRTRGHVEDHYQDVPMTSANGAVFSAEVPGPAVQDPGVDFYIVATDGTRVSTSPTSEPARRPHQIAVFPNKKPAITHTPVDSSPPGQAITITAMVIETPPYGPLDEVALHFRQSNQVFYTKISMDLLNSFHAANIPGSIVSAVGVDYYISATDEHGVTGYHGTREAPHHVTVKEEECKLTVSSTAGGEVTEPGEGTFTYDHGEVVPLQAVANSGYEFDRWTGDTGSIDDTTAAQTTITMLGDYTIHAEFSEVDSPPVTHAEIWADVGGGVAVLDGRVVAGHVETGDVMMFAPNSWVVEVVGVEHNAVDSEGEIWWEVRDATWKDGVTGWVPRTALRCENQDELRSRIEELATRDTRRQDFLQAIAHYYYNDDVHSSLFSGADGGNRFSQIRMAGYPLELIMAIALQEGAAQYRFDNRIYDQLYAGRGDLTSAGVGIMQVHGGIHPCSGCNKAWGSALKNFHAFAQGAYREDGVYVHDYYGNTSQGIYANAKDAFRVLQWAVAVTASIPAAVHRYNGGNTYPARVAARLRTLSQWFPNYRTMLEDSGYEPLSEQELEDLAVELENYVHLTMKSAGTLQIRDHHGRVTGVVNGVVRDEIPNSYYDKGVAILFDIDLEYSYMIAGVSEGVYGMLMTLSDGNTFVEVKGQDIPTAPGAVHRYTIDWDALDRGEKGVTVEIDQNGDGVFERRVVVGDEVTGDDLFGPLTAWASPDPVEGIESVTFGVRGRDAQKVERIRVRVTDQAGYAVFPPAEQEGTRLIWDTLEPTGVPVPNGRYNFSVSVYLEGRWVVLPLQSLIIHR